MNTIISFLRRAFPPKARMILPNLGYGALLVAIIWYPLPILLKKVDISMGLVYVLIFVLACLVFRLIRSGKPLIRELGAAGWTAIGYIAAGIVLTVFSCESADKALFSGLLLLIVYLITFSVSILKESHTFLES